MLIEQLACNADVCSNHVQCASRDQPNVISGLGAPISEGVRTGKCGVRMRSEKKGTR